MLAVPAAHAADGERVLLKRSEPTYPPIAKMMHVYGQIRMTVWILPSGQVSELKLESGHPLLAKAAADSVRQWKYSAAAETTTTSVVVNFTLP